MARTIVVTSGKGGVGKTTVLANIGIALAKLNLRVLLIDVDFGLNNLDVVMGAENKVVYDFLDVLEGKCRAKQALVQDFFIPNLYIMPSCRAPGNMKIDAVKIKFVLEQLETSFDYIFIDCPAGIEAGFLRAVMCATEALVVTTPHISAIRDADKVISLLHSLQIHSVSLIVNRARGDLILSGDMLNEKIVSEYLKTPLLGVVPEDDFITVSLNNGSPSDVKNSFAGQSFALMAENIHNGGKSVFDVTKRYRGFFGGVRKKVRRLV